MMLVVFQNKIIYMPSNPPFARSEKVADYAAQCRPVVWVEHVVVARDGVRVKLLQGAIHDRDLDGVGGREQKQKQVMVLYFQG